MTNNKERESSINQDRQVEGIEVTMHTPSSPKKEKESLPITVLPIGCENPGNRTRF